EFLIANNAPLAPRPAGLPEPQAKPPDAADPIAPREAPTCKHCGSNELAARWGKYGYYWSCSACSKNTAMPTLCSCCGAQGASGEVVRIRKDGPKYYRVCDACGIEERIWTEPSSV